MIDDTIGGLQGEKLSIASPYRDAPAISAPGVAARLDLLRRTVKRRAGAFTGLLSLCGALGLWSAPALLLYRHTPEQLLDGLIGISVKPITSELIALSALLLYLVATGLLLGAATAPLLPRLRVLRMLLRLAVAPLVGLSLLATMLVAMPLFLGMLIKCFPDLL